MFHRQRDDSHEAMLDRVAFKATVHCLKCFAVGDILGMFIAKAIGADATATIVLAATLAFLSGYLLTLIPLIRSGLAFSWAIGLAFKSITASIAIMAIVDNAIMLMIPGAVNAGLDTAIYWSSLAVSLVIGSVAAFPVNRYFIARGRGYAALHFYW